MEDIVVDELDTLFSQVALTNGQIVAHGVVQGLQISARESMATYLNLCFVSSHNTIVSDCLAVNGLSTAISMQ